MIQTREQDGAKTSEGVIRSGCAVFGAVFAHTHTPNSSNNALFPGSALSLFTMPECAFALSGLFYAVLRKTEYFFSKTAFLHFWHSSDTLRRTPWTVAEKILAGRTDHGAGHGVVLYR